MKSLIRGEIKKERRLGEKKLEKTNIIGFLYLNNFCIFFN